MKAFDTDVLSRILLGDGALVSRLSLVPPDQQAVPVVVIEEILRGRLNVIRQAEAAKSTVSIEVAYQLFERTIRDLSQLRILSYTGEAERAFQEWREQGLRVSSHDLRIAAICVTQEATLVSRNRRDFERVPNLAVKFWN